MLEYAGSQRAGVGGRGQQLELAAVVRRVDWVLFGAVVAVVGVGIWAISGITHGGGGFVTRQILYASVGGVALVAGTLLDPDLYRRYWRVILTGTAGLIAFVYVAGPVTRGSRRWLDLGFFTFQPSEFGKLLFVLALAGFLAERGRRVGEVDTTLRALGLGGILIVLVFLQPDLGTALVYCAALLAVLFVGGTRWTHLAVIAAVATLVCVLVLGLLPSQGIHVLKPYQQQRLTGFANPSSDPAGATYNVNQSKIALASGQLRGRGPSGSSQTNLDFLPEKHTDFVFASFGEQRGFVGGALLLGLYLLIVWRGLRVVAVARDQFSAIVAGGIVVAFLSQVFINAGMTEGIAPITGIPLPFVSVGGSSMIANLAAMGVLLAIHARGRAPRATRRR
jgi:rod shape determining protein RodA